MTKLSSTQPRIAIIGGGVAGTFAALIMSGLPHFGQITLFDRDGRFGRGVAYSASAPWHRINVPAYKMGGLGADDWDGFANWVTDKGYLTSPDFSTSFVPRWRYGEYLCEQLVPLIETGRVAARQDAIASVARNGEVYQVRTETGDVIDADLVFACIGNHAPSPFPGVAPSSRSITNVWASGALDAIGTNDRVLVIGTGATAVDVVVDLVHRGVRAPMTMVSRRGLLPLIDAPAETDPEPLQDWPVPTARGIFQALVNDTRRKVAAGLPWQTTIDTFRLQIADMWANASEVERARFSRHLRAIWMVHRHRLAPDVADLLAQMQRDGRLEVIAGRITGAEATASGHEVAIHARAQETISRSTNWILNCTGPEERYERIDDPLVKSLLATGLARPGHNGLGLDVDPHCRLLNSEGDVQAGLYAIGPATRGAFWETTAASSIRQQLLAVAEQLKRDVV
jgi:uncharacterized NAD(P)/FAD-binding protein YdhS